MQTPRFDTKIAILVRDDLLTWQRLNVTAFLTSGVVAARPSLVGEPYADADGTPYAALLGQPVVVLEATTDQLAAVHRKVVDRRAGEQRDDWDLAVFTRAMFSTGHDAANRDAVRAVPTADLDLVGLGLHGPRNALDKITKGIALHG